MRLYDAVIFDLDGTLLDTLADLRNAVNYALDQMGFPQRSLEQVRSFVGNGVARLMDRAVPGGTSPADTEKALALFKSYYERHSADNTTAYPDIPRLLKALKEKDCRLAVVSNKFDGAVKRLAQEYFPGLLDAAAGERETAGVPKKPHPAMVLQALEQLGVSADRAVYVGDSDVDLQTACNAHMPCISVTWGFRDRDFLLAHGAKRLIDRPMELLPLIQK